jgi:hypothetical protein
VKCPQCGSHYVNVSFSYRLLCGIGVANVVQERLFDVQNVASLRLYCINKIVATVLWINKCGSRLL